jgi:hypothetical protein
MWHIIEIFAKFRKRLLFHKKSARIEEISVSGLVEVKVKKGSVIVINGERFDSSTGEKVVAEVRENVAPETKKADRKQDFGGFFDAISAESKENFAKTAEISRKSGKTSHEELSAKKPIAPEKKRLTKAEKQALLASEIASEIAELEESEPNFSRKNIEVKTAPNWITNYKSGNKPLEIEPDKTRNYQRKTGADSRNVVRHAAKNVRRHAAKSITLNRRYVRAPKATKPIVREDPQRAIAATHPMVSHFAKTRENDESELSEFQIPVNRSRGEFANSERENRIRETEAPYVEHRIGYAAKTKITSSYDDLFARTEDEAQTDFAKFTEENSRKTAATRQPIYVKTDNSRTADGAKFLSEIRAEAERNSRKTDSQILKNALIREQMEAPEPSAKNSKDRRQSEKLQRRIAKKDAPRRKFRAGTIATVMVAALLAGGYLAYVNMPGISLRIAAAQAGVNARTAMVPSGYSQVSEVAYSAGQITLKYKNNGGGSGYSLTQSNTSLNSGTVRETLLPSDSKQIANGIYRYGDQAVWVSGNTLFTLDVNSYMTNQQITDIAASVQS